MLEFMDYVQNLFQDATPWNRDNSYGALNLTCQNILDFAVPRSIRLHVSSLSSPNSASSYSVGITGLLDGSLSYLYTSRSFTDVIASSRHTNLRCVIPGYHQLQGLRQPGDASRWELSRQGKRVYQPDVLLYGRLFLPQSALEALYLRRFSPRTQLKASCVSDSRLPNGGIILAQIQHDAAKYSTEFLYSTDSALIGVKGLYNFGSEATVIDSLVQTLSWTQHLISPSKPCPDPATTAPSPQGRFSMGAEMYYGLMNKSGGLSTGLRFATLPAHRGFPYTMTLTLNPLMGNLSSTYSVLASSKFALSSRFEFNFYSYESELQVGTELWRTSPKRGTDDSDWARIKMGNEVISRSHHVCENDANLAGCLKAKLDQRGSLALLWEGRVKELLYTLGVTVDLKTGENVFKGLGMELHYSP